MNTLILVGYSANRAIEQVGSWSCFEFVVKLWIVKINK